jgi:hypothetical protein
MKPRLAAAIIHRHDGEAVEPVGEVDRVGRTHHHQGGEQREEQAERDQQVLEERHGEARRQRFRREPDDPQGRNQADAQLRDQLDAAGQALGVALGQLQEIVAEADGAVAQGHPQHDPDIAVAEIGPQQRGYAGGDQEHEPAHGRRALLGEQMRFRAVFADRLAFALLQLQPADDVRADIERHEKGEQDGAAAAEGLVAEHIER